MTDPTIKIILAYIGRLPNYFPLFLQSCEKNPTVHWSLLTSEPVVEKLPDNVSRHSFSLLEFSERVESKLGMRIDIRRPYKLCDFKPAYGFLYPELCDGFDFWGHCDADVIFGNLRSFYTADVFLDQVKVQMRGSLSFYRNDDAGNQLFRLPHPQIDYRAVFRNHRNCCFDEWEGLHKLLKENRIPYYLCNEIAEILVPKNEFRFAHRKNYDQQVFTWENGRILRTAWDDSGEKVDEYAYIHLQKRPITEVRVSAGANFCFLPGKIVELERESDKLALAAQNVPDRLWELRFQLKRVPRYLRSLRTVDRYYWKIPK